ncbi:MAG TPA: hypothetical protein VMM57_05085 [Bacteroidota bacterium]|nr:hypothetical protein [Bacteroidota bacterium]
MMPQRIAIVVGAIAGVIVARTLDISSPLPFLGIVLAGMVVSLAGLHFAKRVSRSL